MSTFEVDRYAETFFPHLPRLHARQVVSDAVNREVERRKFIANVTAGWRKLVDTKMVQLPRNWPFR